MNSSTETVQQSTIGPRVKPSELTRGIALAFTRGALVLFMVLGHWIHYFPGAQIFFFKYLLFVPSSFAFITGFIISRVYLPKRLMFKGLKLIGLFILLNLIISFLLPESYNSRILFKNFSAGDILPVYVVGDVWVSGLGKAAAFYILVPLSYLFFLSALLSIAARVYKYAFHVAFAFFLLCIIISGSNGLTSGNLQLVTIGLLGVICGYFPLATIHNLSRHPYLLALAYVGYAIAMAVFNALFPVVVAGTCLTMAVIYLLGARNGKPGRARRYIMFLGKYTLFGYIAQIAILQLLRRGFRHLDLGSEILVLSFFAAFGLTMLSVEAVDRVRAKSNTMDWLYRAVFS